MLKLKKLSEKELIGQMFFISLDAGDWSTLHSREKLYRQYFKTYPPGGVFIRSGSAEQVFSLVKWLQEQSRVPLWISADIERGVGGTFPGGTPFPHAACLGSMDDPASTYEMGRVVGKECRALGINLIFAPVVDLLTDNPVINIRAFHEDPEKVITHARAFLAGLGEEGVHGVIKHFPGHGQFKYDSHLRGESIDKSGWENSSHLLPFKELAESEKKIAIMLAHVTVGNQLLCFNQDFPALVERDFRTNALWITDDLQMNAFSEYIEKSDLVPAKEIILSPVHHWLNPAPYRLLASQIEDLMQDEELKKKVIQKVQTILTFKKRWIDPSMRNIRPGRLSRYLRAPQHLRLARKISGESIICLKKGQFYHLEQKEKVLHIICTEDDDRSFTLQTFRKKLSDFLTTYRENFSGTTTGTTGRRNIISVYQRVYGGVQTSNEKINFVKKVSSNRTEKDILIFWGNALPYLEVMRSFPGSVFWVPSYMPVCQESMFDALIGKIPVTGKLPVKYNNERSAGFGFLIKSKNIELNILKDETPEINQYLQKLIQENVVTGIVLGHYSDKKIRLWTAGQPGNNRLQPILLSENTKFDVASLTKVLVTTPLILHLISKNRLDWNQKLSYFYPTIPVDKKNISIRQLLTHTSGLKAWIPLYEKTSRKDEAIRLILDEPPEAEPGTHIIYSDLGFMLLGDIIEKLTDKSLREAFRDIITSPLNIEDDLFFPSGNKLRSNDWVCSHSNWKTNDPVMNFIDDKNARLFPDGAGHAGLLANLKGIIRMIQMIYEQGWWFDHQIINQSVLQFSFEEKIYDGKIGRALGWDLSTKPSQAGRLYENKSSYGHLAFTGCSLWFDIRRERATVLLTNRTYTGYPVDKFRKIRRKVHNLLASGEKNQ